MARTGLPPIQVPIPASTGRGRSSRARTARITTVVFAVVGSIAVYQALQIKIGNPVEGSNLLWPDSEFNEAIRQINSHFPGVNTLEIVLEAKNPRDPARVARQADTVMTMFKLQSELENGEAPPRATLSFGDYLMEGNRLFAGGNPKWLPLDPTNPAVNAAAIAVTLGSSTKAFSHVIDFNMQNSTVSLWYKDNKQETVDGALAAARAAVDRVGIDHRGDIRVQIARPPGEEQNDHTEQQADDRPRPRGQRAKPFGFRTHEHVRATRGRRQAREFASALGAHADVHEFAGDLIGTAMRVRDGLEVTLTSPAGAATRASSWSKVLSCCEVIVRAIST